MGEPEIHVRRKCRHGHLTPHHISYIGVENDTHLMTWCTDGDYRVIQPWTMKSMIFDAARSAGVPVDDGQAAKIAEALFDEMTGLLRVPSERSPV